MNNDIKSLTQNEEHDIPSKILKTIFNCMSQLFFRSQYVWFLVHLYVSLLPNPRGQLAELIVHIIPLE